MDKSFDIIGRRKGHNPKFTRTLILDSQMEDLTSFGGMKSGNRFKSRFKVQGTMEEIGIDIEDGATGMSEYSETSEDRNIIEDLQDFIEMLHGRPDLSLMNIYNYLVLLIDIHKNGVFLNKLTEVTLSYKLISDWFNNFNMSQKLFK